MYDQNTEQILALEAFASDSFLMINKSLIQIFGLQTAVFLGNLIDKFKYFSNRHMLEEDNGFFLTLDSQSKQIGISVALLRKSKKELSSKNIIKTYRKGIPAKEFYIINFVELINIIKENYRRTSTSEIDRTNTSEIDRNIKKNKYKENKENSYTKNSPVKNKKVIQRKKKPTFAVIKQIVSEYNNIAVSCEIPKVLKITSDRSEKIRLRAKSFKIYTAEEWKAAFVKIKESDFLQGDNDRNWAVTFDWLINSDKNFGKLVEDNFKNKTKKKLPTGMQSWDKYDDIEVIEIDADA